MAKKELREAMVIILLFTVSLTTALFFRALTLTTWDAVQFALALENYNVALHRPHPPGYIAWVALLKLFSLVFDANLASITINAILEGFVAYIMYRILHEIFRVRKSISALAALSWLLNPVSWYYRATAENYASGAFFTITILYLILLFMEDGDMKKALVASFLLGFSGGFRIEIPVFLLPVAACTVIYRLKRELNKRALLSLIILYAVGIAAWLIPQALLCGSFTNWLNVTLGQFSGAFSKTALGSAPIYVIAKNFVKTAGVLISGNSLNILSIPIVMVCIVLVKRIIKYVNKHVYLVIATVLIFSAFTIFVHFGKTGYLLPATTVLSIVLIWFTTKVLKRTKILLIIIALALVLNCFIFIHAAPKHELAKMPYMQRVVLYFLGAHYTFNEIRERDFAVFKFIEVVQEYNPNNTAIIILYPCRAINWRKVMYYAPQYIAVFYKTPTGEKLVAQHHTSLNISNVENKVLHSSLVITSLNLPYRVIAKLGSDTYIYEVKCTNISNCLSLVEKIVMVD